METPVEIEFDCLPLRSVGDVIVPPDASPAFQSLCQGILGAIEAHGTFNTYYLYRGQCTFRLTNDDAVGLMRFGFEGTVFTDDTDTRTKRADLRVELLNETCDWLTEPVVEWMHESTRQAVIVEFDRYITAGDLKKTVERIERMQAESDEHGGFLGMGL